MNKKTNRPSPSPEAAISNNTLMTSIPDYGNITMENARKIYEEAMKQQVLSKYSFPTKPSGDGFYHIYVRDGTKKTARFF